MIGNPQASPIEQLNSQARPRPDLITPGSNGSLEVARPVVFAGRVGNQGDSLGDYLSRIPQGELEGGGQVAGNIPKGLLVAGMAKQFKPAAEMTLEQLVQKVAKGEASMPNYQSLMPAYQNTLTGEVASGSIGASHSTVSEMLPQSWMKNMAHGYKHPDGPFIADEWYNLLRDSKQTQTAAKLLDKGIKPAAIFDALRFANPSTR